MNMKKILAFALCLVLVAGLSIGGTLAWITAQTGPVVNTFTYGDINIDLKEHDYDLETGKLTQTEVTSESDYKMVPGNTLPKDPFVKVAANSEDCWLFVKVDEANDLDTFITYSVNTADGEWKALDNVDNVYYREVSASTSEQKFDILTGNAVTVNSGVTKTQLTNIGNNKPTLTFTAYAVQKDNVATAAAAWAIANPSTGA